MSDLATSTVPIRGGTRCRAIGTLAHPDVVVRCRRDRHDPDEGHVGCNGHAWLAWDDDGGFSTREVKSDEVIPVRYTPSIAQRRTAPYELPWFERNRPSGEVRSTT